MMRIIVVTRPEFSASEADALRLLLDEGADRIHLRKPGSSEHDMRRLIEALPPETYPLLSLHDHLALAAEYGIGGVHLNSRNPLPPEGFRGLVSRSCHSTAEAAACTGEEYLFLSPVFDSISKHGYRAGFSADELRAAAACGAIDTRTIALGGVTPERLPLLRETGFGGAALLGYLWHEASPELLRRRMAEIRRFKM